jgi:hypothetical protein
MDARSARTRITRAPRIVLSLVDEGDAGEVEGRLGTELLRIPRLVEQLEPRLPRRPRRALPQHPRRRRRRRLREGRLPAPAPALSALRQPPRPRDAVTRPRRSGARSPLFTVHASSPRLRPPRPAPRPHPRCLEERRDLDAERRRQPCEALHREVHAPALDAPQIDVGHPEPRRERLLRQPERLTQLGRAPRDIEENLLGTAWPQSRRKVVPARLEQ